MFTLHSLIDDIFSVNSVRLRYLMLSHELYFPDAFLALLTTVASYSFSSSVSFTNWSGFNVMFFVVLRLFLLVPRLFLLKSRNSVKRNQFLKINSSITNLTKMVKYQNMLYANQLCIWQENVRTEINLRTYVKKTTTILRTPMKKLTLLYLLKRNQIMKYLLRKP